MHANKENPFLCVFTASVCLTVQVPADELYVGSFFTKKSSVLHCMNASHEPLDDTATPVARGFLDCSLHHSVFHLHAHIIIGVALSALLICSMY